MGYLKEKKWVMRCYFPDGSFAGLLNNTHFQNNPTFSIELNGGLSELRMKANHSFNDFNFPPDGILTANTFIEPTEGYTGRTVTTQKGVQEVYNGLYVGNIIKISYIRGNSEWQVWSGVYAGLELRYSEGGREEFDHVFTPNIQKLSARIFRDGLNTTITYIGAEPADMLKDVVNSADVGITYTAESVKNTDVTRSYEFKVQYCADALKSVIAMTPYRWYWYLGGDDMIYLKNIDDEDIVHNISYNDTVNLRFEKTISFIRNKVLFVGGGDPALFLEFNSGGSQTAWGVYEQLITDTSVTDATTAEDISRRYLAEFAGGRNFFTIEISGDAFDIENINVGDQLQLHTNSGLDFSVLVWGSFVWGTDAWKYDFYAIAGIPAVIQRITHRFDSIICECAFNYEQYAEKINSYQKQIDKINTELTPSSPS